MVSAVQHRCRVLRRLLRSKFGSGYTLENPGPTISDELGIDGISNRLHQQCMKIRWGTFVAQVANEYAASFC
jgi:hypothetical protein